MVSKLLANEELSLLHVIAGGKHREQKGKWTFFDSEYWQHCLLLSSILTNWLIRLLNTALKQPLGPRWKWNGGLNLNDIKEISISTYVSNKKPRKDVYGLPQRAHSLNIDWSYHAVKPWPRIKRQASNQSYRRKSLYFSKEGKKQTIKNAQKYFVKPDVWYVTSINDIPCQAITTHEKRLL